MSRVNAPGLIPILTVLGTVGFIVVVAGVAVGMGVKSEDIALVGFISFGGVVVLFAAAVLYQIGTGKIPLSGIISEPMGISGDAEGRPKASLSRFQFLIFTFVVAGLFLMLSIKAEAMVDVPQNVLILMGLSGGGYLAAKVAGGGDGGADTSAAARAQAAQAQVQSLETELDAARKAAATAQAEAEEAAKQLEGG
ncbi:MAG: hypothetical protein AAF761_06510 [Pseudomonadota bacterium]